MSPQRSSLPARPSLKQLRKQAKERLAERRVSEPSTTLSDAQLSLARDYGFTSWPQLVHHVESAQPQQLSRFERLASEIAAAYTTANFTAIREINWRLATSFVWSEDTERMHERLTSWFASDWKGEDLALRDARDLVARQFGHDDWGGLVRQFAAPATSGAKHRRKRLPAGLNLYQIDERASAMTIKGPLVERDWDEIFTVLSDRRLTTLRAGSQITDAALRRLAQRDVAARLDVLDLGGPGSRLTDSGLNALRHFPALRQLSIAWAPRVTDAGMAHLALCERLERLDLMGTSTGDAAVLALAGQSTLRDFRSGRFLTDAGLKLFASFPQFTSSAPRPAEYGLMRFDAGPTFLLLDGSFTDAGLECLVDLDGLAGLSFSSHLTALTPNGLAPLARLRTLAFLGCQGSLCDDVAMRHIGACPTLRMLMGQGTVASDEGFVALSRSESIEHIWTGRDHLELTGRGFAALAAMPALRGLAVSCKHLDDAALSLLPSFRRLRELVTIDVSDAGFQHVGACHALERLWCMYCQDTGDLATTHITGLARLTHYYAGATRITDRTLRLLAGMPSLESLAFWSTTGISDEGVVALAALPRLREIAFDATPQVTRQATNAFPPGVRVQLAG